MTRLVLHVFLFIISLIYSQVSFLDMGHFYHVSMQTDVKPFNLTLSLHSKLLIYNS